MIAMVTGVVAGRDEETVIVQTDGGVGYAVAAAASVLGQLPAVGARVTLHTELVVREDGWALYGFATPGERAVFRRLLGASGVGPKLALAMVSMLGAERLVRSIQAKDLAALSSVSGVGRKRAERLVLELQDKFSGIAVEPAMPRAPGSEEAARALVGLGYSPAAADDAVQAALAAGASASDPAQLIRRALQQLAAARGGR